MFNNLLSKDDLPFLLEKLRQGYGPRILRSLVTATADKRVLRVWSVAETPPKHWGSLDAIQERWNILTTSRTDTTVYEYVADRHLRRRKDLVAISLACGTGAHEERFAATGRFARIDGFDISENRIERAKERATAAGLGDVLRFEVGDARKLEVQPSSYDVAIAFNALHHLTPLAPVVDFLKGVLKPGGLLILRDYVGPDRFQWTDPQLEAANKVLAELPLRFRVQWRSGTVKKRVFRPGRLLMRLADPSEAAEPSNILPLLDAALDPIERKDLGGTILHLVLKDIAHHFARSEPKADQWLDRLITAEDEILAQGELGSDFVFGIWRKN